MFWRLDQSVVISAGHLSVMFPVTILHPKWIYHCLPVPRHVMESCTLRHAIRRTSLRHKTYSIEATKIVHRRMYVLRRFGSVENCIAAPNLTALSPRCKEHDYKILVDSFESNSVSFRPKDSFGSNSARLLRSSYVAQALPVPMAVEHRFSARTNRTLPLNVIRTRSPAAKLRYHDCYKRIHLASSSLGDAERYAHPRLLPMIRSANCSDTSDSPQDSFGWSPSASVPPSLRFHLRKEDAAPIDLLDYLIPHCLQIRLSLRVRKHWTGWSHPLRCLCAH